MEIKDLKEKLKIFNNKDVILENNDLLGFRFELDNCYAEFNSKTGDIIFGDKSTSNQLKVNIGIINEIDLTDSILLMELEETSLKIYIKQKMN